MIDGIIEWSLRNRLVVLVAAVLMIVWGLYETSRMPVDVFPDLTAPTVTVVAESHGMAPADLEQTITLPIESALNGATGVRRVRSNTFEGIAVIKVDFDWGVDLLEARQVVSERLQLVASQLPSEAEAPVIGPLTSVMGEILFIGLTSENPAVRGMELGTLSRWTIARRLLAVPGVAQVMPLGGDTKQFQVVLDPSKLDAFSLTAEDVAKALEASNENMPAGFLVEGGSEELITGLGRVESLDDIAGSLVAMRGGLPVRVSDVANVRIGPAVKRGSGGVNGLGGVVIGVRKQPGVNTLKLTAEIQEALEQLEQGLPKGVTLHRNLFRQADFIEVAVDNVTNALRDGALLVILIVLLFLGSGRATLITATAIPLSLLAAVLAMQWQGIALNTMTLGGMAIAVGALVDDAIIDVENVARRLRENHNMPDSERRPSLLVVLDASIEIRRSIVFATFIIVLVFTPLFFLTGVEGRMLQPLGFAYATSLGASLVVALTVTPVLCLLLLPTSKMVVGNVETKLVAWLKARYQPMLSSVVARWRLLAFVSVVLFAIASVGFALAGRTFLPQFNEGALTINVMTPPGTSLDQATAIGDEVEELLLTYPEVISTARRTGRGDGDDHAQAVSSGEIEVRLRESERGREAFLRELRADFRRMTGVGIVIGQPLEHRIDHIISGTRASIAVKVFGDELVPMREVAQAVEAEMAQVDGVVDLNIEQQTMLPFVSVKFDRRKLARHGLSVHDVADEVATAFQGRAVSKVYEGAAAFDLVVRYDLSEVDSFEAVSQKRIGTPSGARVPLHAVADVRRDLGPNGIGRENVRRKLVVMANVADRDVVSVVEEIRERVNANVELPDGYYIDYGGQFQSANEASRTLTVVGGIVLVGILILLIIALRSTRDAVLVMLNLPLALIGGVVGVYLSGGVVSIASLIGFITLFGIATRNGIMMVTHIQHLRTVEGVVDPRHAVLQGAEERLAPILMTALASGFGLLPLALALGEPGSEIQAPMAIVILCGLTTSTALNMFVIPALYLRFGTYGASPPQS